MRVLAVSHACVVDVNQALYRQMEAMGHEVSIVVPERWRHVYTRGDFPAARLSGFTGPLVPLPLWGAGSATLHTYVASISLVIHRMAPDTVYLEEEPYSVAAFQWTRAGAGLRIPTVFFTAQNITKTYPFPFRLSERYVWARTHAAVCATRNVASALAGRGYRGITHVVPYAVDVDLFRPRTRSGELQRRLGLRGQVVAYLGRLVEEKGVRVLLNAYRRLRVQVDATLLCLGGGPLAAECRAQAGVVVAEGIPHAAIPDYLALADLTVLPSLTTARWKEQFGRAAVEAMACGLPVIGSDSGAIPEVVHGADGGMIVPEGNAAALADAMERLLGDPRSRAELGDRGRKGVSELYSTSSVAKRLAAVLASAASSGH